MQQGKTVYAFARNSHSGRVWRHARPAAPQRLHQRRAMAGAALTGFLRLY